MRKHATRSTTHWLLLALTLMLLMPMTACHKKTPGEKIQEGIEKVGDGISDAADDVKDKAEEVKEDVQDEVDGQH